MSLPTRPSSTSRLTTRWRSGPSPSSPAAQPRAAPQPSSTSSSPRSPSASRASKSMAGWSSGPSSRTHAESATCASSSCRRSGPSSTATSNAPRARGDTSSTASKISRPASNPSSSASTPSPIASITQGLTKPLAISPQPSTSQPSARRSPRLTWAELGHLLVHLVEQVKDVARGQRLAEEIALHLGAAFLSQVAELLVGLDALGGRCHAEVLAEPGDGPDDRDGVVLVRHVAHERLIDLDLVEGEAAQVAQARVARAEVVHRDLDPEV